MLDAHTDSTRMKKIVAAAATGISAQISRQTTKICLRNVSMSRQAASQPVVLLTIVAKEETEEL